MPDLKWTQTTLGDRPDCDPCLLWMVGQPGLAPQATVDRYHADGHHDVARLTAERDKARESLTEANATIVRAMEALGVGHPVWLILDGYDGTMDNVTALVAERDEARAVAEPATTKDKADG